MFKRTILAAAALSILAGPMAAQAQSRHEAPRASQHETKATKSHSKSQAKSHAKAPSKNERRNWARGQRLDNWKERQSVNDYSRHGLKRPGAGQRWVKVDNNYLLVSFTTGLIVGIAAAR